MAFRFLVTASLAALAFSKPARRGLQVHESRPSAPAGFSLSGAAPPDTILNLRLALVRNDEAGLIESLYDVSTPTSPNYGQHLTKEEVCAAIAPGAVPRTDVATRVRSRRMLHPKPTQCLP